MTSAATKRQKLPLAMATLAALPLAGTLHASAASAASLHATQARTIRGILESVNHGPVQVSIVVKRNRIIGLKVTTSPQEGRSAFIQSQAIPALKQETLHAQSARIQVVSGATDTSDGYIASLQSAINAAKKAKVLR